MGGMAAGGELQEGHVHLENLRGVEVVVLEMGQQVGLALVRVFAEYALQVYLLLFLHHKSVQGLLLLLPQLLQPLGLLVLQHLHLPLLGATPVHNVLEVDLQLRRGHLYLRAENLDQGQHFLGSGEVVEVAEDLQVGDLLLLVLSGVEARSPHGLGALHPQVVDGLDDGILEADDVLLVLLCSFYFPAQLVVGLNFHIIGQVVRLRRYIKLVLNFLIFVLDLLILNCGLVFDKVDDALLVFQKLLSDLLEPGGISVL